MSITQKRKPIKHLYQFLNLWNWRVPYFSAKLLNKIQRKWIQIDAFFFSVHFSPFSDFNNESDNTNFSYHFNLSSLLSSYNSYSCQHVISTLSEWWDTPHRIWLTDPGLKLPMTWELPFCLIPAPISFLYITFFKLF